MFRIKFYIQFVFTGLQISPEHQNQSLACVGTGATA